VPVVDIRSHEIVVVPVLGIDGLGPVFAVSLDLKDCVLPSIIVIIDTLDRDESGPWRK
jgi:hypothetical protein